jgi:hypothetical protein
MIKNYGYDLTVSKGEYIYAFFPAFPLLLKYSQIPTVYIPFLNFILFVIGLLFLIAAFTPPKDALQGAMLCFMFPGIISFIIPYSESLFFLCISIAFFGFVKKHYWLVFIGLIVAGTVRPAVAIFLISLLCGAIYTMIKSRKINSGLGRLAFFTLPLTAGTFAVMLYQWGSGSSSLFAFADAQKLWDHYFRIPTELRDWSLEGFGMNMFVLFVFAPFVLGLYLPMLVNMFKSPDTHVSKLEFIQISSLAYVTGSSLFVLFFQGGSLNGLFRYVLSTPMFFVLILSFFEKIQEQALLRSVAAYFLLALICIMVMSNNAFAEIWNFFDLGLYISLAGLLLGIQINLSRNTYWKILGWIVILGNALWTSYLFNNFLSDSWIFT